MEALFPDWLTSSTKNLDLIFAAPTKLKLTILVKNPNFASTGDPGTGTVSHITSVASLTTLLANPAWQDVNQPAGRYVEQNWNAAAQPSLDVTLSDSQTPGAPVVGSSRFATVSTGGFNYWPVSKPAIATGFIVSIDNPALPENGNIVAIFRPDTPIFLTGESATLSSSIGALTHMFSYVEANGTNATDGWSLQLGDISITVPTVDWEAARSVHVWIDPQRINFVMNPSFRTGNMVGWRTNATATQVNGGINRIDLMSIDDNLGPGVAGTEATAKCASLTGTSPIILESNFFPTNAATENWRVSAEVSGTGKFRVGIVFFQPSMAESEAVYLATPWQTFSGGSANQGDFRRIFASLPAPDTTKEGCVRIEYQGAGPIWIDEVLAAPEDGPGTYFDAMSPLAQPQDYSWYGGIYGMFHDQSYSLFYPNRSNLETLMFSYLTQHEPDPAPPVIVRGEAHNWVPEGVNVVPHWDDVFSTRTHSWLEDVIVPPKDFVTKNVVTNLTP